MIKLRFQGTRSDIQRLCRLLCDWDEVEVKSISDLYRNKGTDRYVRAYADLELDKEETKAKGE